MKLNAAEIARALDRPGEGYSIFFLYGPDESGSRTLAGRLEVALGAGAERVDIDGSVLKEDPARLPDEAASLSLFGDKRHIRVSGGDECTASVSALLSSNVANPVVIVSGALKATSSLVKLVIDRKDVACFASFKAVGQKAGALATSIANRHGVRLGHGVATRLIDNCGGDSAVLEREIEKIALFLDAAPDRPREASTDTLDGIAANLDDAIIGELTDPALDGDLALLAEALDGFATDTIWVPNLRALQRRILLLARLRSEIERGKSAEAVITSAGRSIYSSEQPAVSRQLPRWGSDRLARAHSRLFAAEATAMDAGSAGTILPAEALLAIGRVAERHK